MEIKMNGEQFAVIVFAVALAFSCFGYAAKDYYAHRDPKVNVELWVSENAGPSTLMYSGNLITDIGETFCGESAITGEDNNDTWAISLSNDGSASAAWTVLPAEVAANGFTRAAADETAAWSNSGDWAKNYTYTFTATGTQQLQTAGLNWDSTSQGDNTLFAAADFTQTTFETDDTLTVLWIITFNAN